MTVGTDARSLAERALRYEDGVLLVGAALRWQTAFHRLPELQPDVLLLEAGSEDDDTVAALEAFAERAPSTQVVVLDARASPAALRRAMLAGASAYLPLPPASDELRLALRRAGNAALGRTDAPERRSTVTAVWSPKGGAGCSTLAVNLAIALQSAGEPVVVVDGDPAHGDLEVLLDLEPGPTLADLLSGELGREAINDAALPHPSGVRALLAPSGGLAGVEVDPERLRAVLQALRGSFRHVVVDAGTALDDRAFVLLDVADRVVVVVTPEPAAYRRVGSFLELASALGIGDKLLLVLNRYDAELGAPLDGVERELGRAFDRRVGDAPRELLQAATEGVPLLHARPGHPVARDIAALAESVRG